MVTEYNPEYQKEYNKKYRNKGSPQYDKLLKDKQISYHKHKVEISKRRKITREKVKIEVFDHYGGKCECCGESELKFLAINHKDGGGSKHRKTISGGGCGHSIYRWLQKNNYPENFNVLCHNCNMAEGFFGSCPHND